MIRRIVQTISMIVINSYPGIKPGAGKFLYQGNLKQICVPILNCYSCPLAWGSCPIGSVQQSLKVGIIPLFAAGFFGAIGILTGRLVCGWLCPFGFLQEILFKIKTVKLRLPTWTRYIKYAVLMLTIIVPIFLHQPFFCKFICPSGTLGASIWQILMQPMLIESIGFYFTLKYLFLFIFISGSITFKRFFCVTLCPIGAIYGLFNKISLLRMKTDMNKCTECEQCRLNCPMDISIYKNSNHFDCIRCFKCISVCPHNAVTNNIPIKSKKAAHTLNPCENISEIDIQ